MKRLSMIPLGVAHVCGGMEFPRPVFHSDNNELLLEVLSLPKGFEMVRIMFETCAAVVHAANTRQISVACAYGYYHRLFSVLLCEQPRGAYPSSWGALLRDRKFQGVFDLAGITVKDEEFHFATPDFEQVTYLVTKIIREKKSVQTKSDKGLLGIAPPKKPPVNGYRKLR